MLRARPFDAILLILVALNLQLLNAKKKFSSPIKTNPANTAYFLLRQLPEQSIEAKAIPSTGQYTFTQ